MIGTSINRVVGEFPDKIDKILTDENTRIPKKFKQYLKSLA